MPTGCVGDRTALTADEESIRFAASGFRLRGDPSSHSRFGTQDEGEVEPTHYGTVYAERHSFKHVLFSVNSAVVGSRGPAAAAVVHSEPVGRVAFLADRSVRAGEHDRVLDEAVEALQDIVADDLATVQIALTDEYIRLNDLRLHIAEDRQQVLGRNEIVLRRTGRGDDADDLDRNSVV